MQPSRIRLVCFDLGGVLVRICRTWQEGCAAAGLDLRGSHHLLDVPNGWYVTKELFSLHETGQIQCDEYFARVSKAIDERYTPHEIRMVHDAWLLGEYKGVFDIVSRLNDNGVPTAALSNTNHSHWELLIDYPVIRELRYRFASHQLSLAKPNPKIFAEVERHTSVRAQDILYFDDLAPNIDAARERGWNAVLINPHAPTHAQIETALCAHDLTP